MPGRVDEPGQCNRPNEDVCIQGSFRRDNGYATDIAQRENLTLNGLREQS